MYRCGLRFTVGNENRVSTGRNGSKNGYAKNTVLGNVSIRVIMGLLGDGESGVIGVILEK